MWGLSFDCFSSLLVNISGCYHFVEHILVVSNLLYNGTDFTCRHSKLLCNGGILFKLYKDSICNGDFLWNVQLLSLASLSEEQRRPLDKEMLWWQLVIIHSMLPFTHLQLFAQLGNEVNVVFGVTLVHFVCLFGAFHDPLPDVGQYHCVVLESVLGHSPFFENKIRMLFNHFFRVEVNLPIWFSLSSSSLFVALVEQDVNGNRIDLYLLEVVGAHANHPCPLLWNLFGSSLFSSLFFFFKVILIFAICWVWDHFRNFIVHFKIWIL